MNKFVMAALAVTSLASPAFALPDDACQAEWNRADANKDGVLIGAEARPYLSSMATPPANGEITASAFLTDCKADRIKLSGTGTMGTTTGAVVPSTGPAATQTAKIDPGAPLPGANSFTEEQARDRIAKAGYADVSGLKKDDQGIWRGTAMKAGAQVSVAIDYRGNVVPQ